LFALALSLAFLALSLDARAGQRNASGHATASISGRVVDGDTGEPVASARIVLRQAREQRMTSSGPDGSFAFDALPAGVFSVQVDADGYLRGAPGMLTPWDSARLIQASAGELVSGEVIRLWRHVSISGTVRDESGEPVVQAIVQPLRVEFVGGQRTFEIARDTGAVDSFVTDDRGAYRITGLRPADYVVMAGPGPGAQRYLTGFSGSVRSVRQALVVPLKPGEDRIGVDFQIGTFDGPGLVEVSGRLVAPGVGSSATVRLVPAEFTDDVAGLGELGGSVQPDGTFTFPSVPPGSYRLQAWHLPESGPPARVMRVSGLPVVVRPARTAGQPAEAAPTTPTWVADVPIDVTRRVRELEVPLAPGGRISGRIVFEGSAARLTPQQLTTIVVSVQPAYERWLGVIPTGRVEADGRFRTAGIPPGAYTLRFDLNATGAAREQSWQMTSIGSGPVPLLGRAIEIGASDVDVTVTFGSGVPRLTGTLRADAETIEQARVILFSRDARLRGHGLTGVPGCVQLVRPDRAGRFTARALRECDYLAAAVLRPPRLWMDPDYLASLVPLATPVTLHSDGTGEVELRLD
jgi:protocatechuate 3,4-dioxygenase beta subunit